jgi:hypothetical protein
LRAQPDRPIADRLLAVNLSDSFIEFKPAKKIMEIADKFLI